MIKLAQFIFACNSLSDISASKSVLRICLLNSIIMAVVIPLGAYGPHATPCHWFGERHLMTWISGFQLAATAWFAWKIWLERKAGEIFKWKNPSTVWIIMSFGFFFLTLDELAKIHENLDALVHKIFNLTETAITDRIDDLLLLLYGLIGIAVLFRYRSEFLKYRKSFNFLFIAAMLSVISIFLDVLANRVDILNFVLKDELLALKVFEWAGLVEDILKIFAEIFFLGAFIRCFTLTRDKEI